MLFQAGRAIGREFEDQNALAFWSGRYIEDGFRDRLIRSAIARSFGARQIGMRASQSRFSNLKHLLRQRLENVLLTIFTRFLPKD